MQTLLLVSYVATKIPVASDDVNCMCMPPLCPGWALLTLWHGNFKVDSSSFQLTFNGRGFRHEFSEGMPFDFYF